MGWLDDMTGKVPCCHAAMAMMLPWLSVCSEGLLLLLRGASLLLRTRAVRGKPEGSQRDAGTQGTQG